MGLPRVVIEANERADALMAQRAAQNGTPQAAAPAAATQAAPEVPAAPVAQSTAGEPAPAQAPAPTASPAQTPAFESTWEQRFKVLDGKYKAEVPRLHNEIKDLKATVSNLQSELAAAKQAPAPRVEFTAEEREQFGDELLNVVARVAAAQAPAAPAAAQVDLSPVTERMQKIEKFVAETAEDAFFRELGKKVPHWSDQNTDAGFVKWLTEVDPLTGRVRQDLFNEAYDELNVARIAAFFTAYPYQSNVARTGAEVPSLESQVAPDVSRSNPPTPPGKKVWTRAEIQQHYEQVRRAGMGQDMEALARIEQDIFAAQKEGRVR